MSPFSQLRHRSIWPIVISVFAVAAPASGQSPGSTSGIEEIVVIGDESSAAADFEAADSVTGFGAEDLAALGVQSIADIASFTPNLEIVTSGATTPTFFIRGVGLNDFNANSTGAVAIYQDDVALNAPALQLSTLFDVESVNVLRGPQGTGLARNASAGAIKIYNRKPSGEFGGYLNTEFGNFGYQDYKGAVEAPIFGDLLAGRIAFNFTDRDGTMRNRCGNALAVADRLPRPTNAQLQALGKTPNDRPWSICGESIAPNEISLVPAGLASRVNDRHSWALRGTLLFQPTLDMTWLLNVHGARRKELSRLGQSIGTLGFSCAADDFNCRGTDPTFIAGVLGGRQGILNPGYRPREVTARLIGLAPCFGTIPDSCRLPGNAESANRAKRIVARELANGLDSQPWVGDFNRTGPTSNDTVGGYLQGEIVLPWDIEATYTGSFDSYDRVIDIDLDFSPETLFQILTKDEGWQFGQDLKLKGQLGDESAIRWETGGWFLHERLGVLVENDLGKLSIFGAGARDYTQELSSAAGYASLSFDFWDDFRLDGGFRFNWERKTLDYALTQGAFADPFLAKLDESWSAGTGTVRLTYDFREDTHVFWKYTRGWKPGTFNATSALRTDFATGAFGPDISVAEPEEIDAFETGVAGSWLDGRLNLDLSVFYYSYQNYQIFTAQQFAGGQPEFVIVNADEAEVYGAELDVVVRPWSTGFVNVRVGWLESQFIDFVQVQQEIINQPGVGQTTVNRELQNTGNNLLNSPRWKVSLTAEQTLPMGRWGSLIARYDGVWTDTTFFDATEGRGIPNIAGTNFLPENTIAQRPFWTHNVRLSYADPNGTFEVSAWVRNVANFANKTFAFDGSTFNKTTIYFVGDPRTFGGSVSVRF